ncbi:MAG TPA: hypothetical protein DHW64_01550 [Chitinophagaceae bacterium]|nr:hypothetical protein [Chitinophagaceae bacterium]
MPDKNSQEIILTLVLGTSLVLFFALAIVFLFYMFNKKKQLYTKEKELLRNSYEKELLQSQVEMQEQIFNNISRELHDNVGQVLSLVKVQLNILTTTERFDVTLLKEASDSISTAMNDLRDISGSISGSRVLEQGLISLTQKLLARIGKTGKIKTSLEEKGTFHSLSGSNSLLVFRIIQESVQNVLKHASASLIQVVFNYTAQMLEVSVIDDGKGFDVIQIAEKGEGMGLKNIQHRIHLAGGNLSIESTPGKGTQLILIIPYA